MNCLECKGKCCVGDIEVYPRELLYNNTDLTIEKPNINYEKYMIVDENNKCICLVNGSCSIYNERPEICRDFQYDSNCCKSFQSGEKTAHTCKKCMFNKN